MYNKYKYIINKIYMIYMDSIQIAKNSQSFHLQMLHILIFCSQLCSSAFLSVILMAALVRTYQRSFHKYRATNHRSYIKILPAISFAEQTLGLKSLVAIKS